MSQSLENLLAYDNPSARRIRDAMKLGGVTGKELSEVSGIAAGQISRSRYGRVGPKVANRIEKSLAVLLAQREVVL